MDVDTTASDQPVQWRFKVADVALDNVDCQLKGLPMGNINTEMGAIRLKEVNVGLEEQVVDVESVMLLQGGCSILLAESTTEPTEVSSNTEEGLPWQIRVGTVELQDNHFLMKPLKISEQEECFPETIRISAKKKLYMRMLMR